MTLRLWRLLKPRLAAERMTTVYETLERPLVAGAGAHGAARHLDRPRRCCRGSPASSRRSAAGLEAEIHELAGEQVQPRLPQAARRHPVRQAGPARRQQDQDRPMVDRRARARGPGRAGPRAAAEDPRLAAALQAEVDLHRRAAGLHQPEHGPRPHLLRAGRDARPAGCRRPSRTCRTSRSAPRKAARSAAPSSPRPGPSSSRPTTPRSSCACSPTSPTSSR